MKNEELVSMYYDLEGVIIDIEEGNGFDEVCLQTLKNLRDLLSEKFNQQEKAA